ncbi:MAG: hypothetical protein J6Y60_12265 [Treponema sp.]|nr:hypothetical protein [Treponema sp.]
MTFEYEYNGMKITFTYSAKDYVATYDSQYCELKGYRHMMYMAPLVFSEDFLRKKCCMDIAVCFEKIIQFLGDHPDFIQNAKQELEKLIAPYEVELAELRQKKMEMKKLFKHGKISEKEYKSVIEQLREMELKIHRTKFNFYRQLEEEYEIDLEGIKHLLLGEW